MRSIRSKDLINPERIMDNLINDYLEGALTAYDFLFRAVVYKVDKKGGQLAKDPPNPKNSIVAKIITAGMDSGTPEKDLPVFWPIFPYDGLPIKEGEHVYVLFEDAYNKNHGLWLTRIPESLKTDKTNLTLGFEKYKEEKSNDIDSDIASEKRAQSAPENSKVKTPPLSPEFVKEDVPNFIARVGDRTLEGSNNTLISLGRDRPSKIDSGQKEGAGTIDIVSGRSNTEGDLDLESDLSRIYITSKSDTDKNFNIKAGSAVNGTAAIVCKSDEIRIVARSGTKIIVEKGDVYIKNDGKVTVETTGKVDIKAAGVNVGGEDSPAALGDKVVEILDSLINAFMTHDSHVTPLGPSGPSPTALAKGAPLLAKLETIKSKTVNIKK